MSTAEFAARPLAIRYAIFSSDLLHDQAKGDVPTILAKPYEPSLLGTLGQMAAYQAVKAKYRLQCKEMDIRSIKMSQAGGFRFAEIGHPKEGTLYIEHPARPDTFVPAASFHKVMFEHKVWELFNLLECLGASELNIERKEGLEVTVGLRVGLDRDGASGSDRDQKGSGSLNGKWEQRSSYAMGNTARFDPPVETPYLPDELFWYYHEEDWQQVAKRRLTPPHRLAEWGLTFAYKNDLSVNGKLEATAKGLGLSLGGEFVRMVSTEWRINVRF